MPFIIGFFTMAAYAQSLSIAPAHVVCDYDLGIKLDTQIKNKMLKALTTQGISTLSDMSRFALLPSIGILSERTMADLPPKTEMELDVSFALVDALTGNVFDSKNFNIQAKGTNKINAIYNGVSKLSLDTHDFQQFIQKAKVRVIDFYESSLNSIFLKAQAAAQQYDYEQALYILAEVPSEIPSYKKVVAMVDKYYREYENKIAGELFRRAEAAWISSPNLDGAQKAAAILAEIPIQTKYDKSVNSLMAKIEKQLSEQDRREWALISKELERRHKEKMSTISAWRDVSVAYARNQPKQYTKVVFW